MRSSHRAEGQGARHVTTLLSGHHLRSASLVLGWLPTVPAVAAVHSKRWGVGRSHRSRPRAHWSRTCRAPYGRRAVSECGEEARRDGRQRGGRRCAMSRLRQRRGRHAEPAAVRHTGPSAGCLRRPAHGATPRPLARGAATGTALTPPSTTNTGRSFCSPGPDAITIVYTRAVAGSRSAEHTERFSSDISGLVDYWNRSAGPNRDAGRIPSLLGDRCEGRPATISGGGSRRRSGNRALRTANRSCRHGSPPRGTASSPRQRRIPPSTPHIVTAVVWMLRSIPTRSPPRRSCRTRNARRRAPGNRAARFGAATPARSIRPAQVCSGAWTIVSSPWNAPTTPRDDDEAVLRLVEQRRGADRLIRRQTLRDMGAA